MSESLYAKAGVNIDKGNQAVRNAGKANYRTSQS